MAAKLDALANERIKTHKILPSKVKEAQTDKESVKETKKEPVKNLRRNAIVYIEPEYGGEKFNDIHSKHSRLIYKILESIPSIEYSKKLNKEIDSIRRAILKKQIIADVIKYSEYLASASDINKDCAKKTDKFLAKVKRSLEDLKTKYGEKVYGFIEHLIREVMRYPFKKNSIDKDYSEILSIVMTLIMKNDKSSLYDPKAFPHPIMIFHEVHYILT